MAQTDFFFNADALYLETPTTGQPVLHASLSNPLTEEGVYCRYWETTTAATLSDTKGVFARSTDTKLDTKLQAKPSAYSIRALIRIPSSADFSRTAAGLRIKSDNTRRAGSNTNPYTGGYKLFVHNGQLYTGLETDGGTETQYTISDPLGVTIEQDTWYRIRMDITPQRLNGNIVTDNIKYFTGTGVTNREAWTLVAERDFTGSNFIAWQSATYKNNGFFLIDTHSGHINIAPTAKAAAYFDSFQVLVSGR